MVLIGPANPNRVNHRGDVNHKRPSFLHFALELFIKWTWRNASWFCASLWYWSAFRLIWSIDIQVKNLFGAAALRLTLLFFLPGIAPVEGWDRNSSRNLHDYINENLKPHIFPDHFCNEDVLLVIVVNSRPDNLEARKAIRETWGQKRKLSINGNTASQCGISAKTFFGVIVILINIYEPAKIYSSTIRKRTTNQLCWKISCKKIT